MKPHIRKNGALWLCGVLGSLGFVGVGYTPAMAYAEWEALCKQ